VETLAINCFLKHKDFILYILHFEMLYKAA